MLVIVFGLPGTGKSYFAERLAKTLDARYLSSDIVRKELSGETSYEEDAKERVYDEMLSIALRSLAQYEPVVVDATFYRVALRGKFANLAQSMAVTPVFIEIQCDEELIRERVERKREHSDADWEVFLKVRDAFEPLDEKHLVLRSERNNIDSMLDEAITYIDSLDETE